ncbi:MAG: DUF433 domain-containing protein [Bacteroidota bacterium]
MYPIIVNPEILGGTPVFRGTRVPVKFMFDYLLFGDSVESFVEDYPTVSKELANQVLNLAAELVEQKAPLYDENLVG